MLVWGFWFGDSQFRIPNLSEYLFIVFYISNLWYCHLMIVWAVITQILNFNLVRTKIYDHDYLTHNQTQTIIKCFELNNFFPKNHF